MKAVLFVFVALSANASVAQTICSRYTIPAVYKKTQESIESKMQKFANSKDIATQADATLSKLITAKSPLINSWFSKRDLSNKSEDEVIKAWRVYFAKNFILGKYPQGDKKIDAEIEKLVDGILKDNLKPAFQTRLDKLFARAQQESLAMLESLNIEHKKEAIERVKAIKLYWPKTLKAARNNAMPLDLIDWGIAYDPVPNEINIGIDALSYPNDETYLAVFAHEIGHSIDSCRWGAFLSGKWPFEKVGECLRSDNSVGAKKRDDSALDKMVKSGQVPEELATSLKQNPTCNKLVYPPSDIQADQLVESFADWFSAEVVARMSGLDFMNMRTDLCGEKALSKGSSYVSNSDRLNKIYLAQPNLKEKTKASSKIIHCTL